MAEVKINDVEYKAFEDLSIGSLFRYRGQYYIKITKVHNLINSVSLLHGDLHYIADEKMVWTFNKIDIIEGTD